jgi:hypothetical protein
VFSSNTENESRDSPAEYSVTVPQRCAWQAVTVSLYGSFPRDAPVAVKGNWNSASRPDLGGKPRDPTTPSCTAYRRMTRIRRTRIEDPAERHQRTLRARLAAGVRALKRRRSSKYGLANCQAAAAIIPTAGARTPPIAAIARGLFRGDGPRILAPSAIVEKCSTSKP